MVKLPTQPGSRTQTVLAGLLLLLLCASLTISGCAAPAVMASKPIAAAGAMATATVDPDLCIAPIPLSVPIEEAMAVDPVRLLEDRYGIRVTLIGVTAGGGMIDFRYKVLDPDKATRWIQDADLMPHLMAEKNGTEIGHSAGMAHSATLLPGRVYYMLYGNAGGAIQPGDAVTVMVGDLRVPVNAQ